MIYFVRQGDDGPVKIGYVREDRGVESRLRTLQVASPDELHLLAVANGGPALERQLHRAFQSDRVRGEWFAWSDLMAKVIDAYITDPDADIFAPLRRAELEARPKVSARTVRRRAARAAFERAVADGTLKISYPAAPGAPAKNP